VYSEAGKFICIGFNLKRLLPERVNSNAVGAIPYVQQVLWDSPFVSQLYSSRTSFKLANILAEKSFITKCSFYDCELGGGNS